MIRSLFKGSASGADQDKRLMCLHSMLIFNLVQAPCPAGTFSRVNFRSCSRCPAGMYSTVGSSTCTRCSSDLGSPPCPSGSAQQVDALPGGICPAGHTCLLNAPRPVAANAARWTVVSTISLHVASSSQWISYCIITSYLHHRDGI